MKSIFLLISLVSFLWLTGQNTKEFSYLVGSNKVPGYGIQSCVFDASKYSLKSNVAPILQVYVLNKEKFVDGLLEDEKGKKTIIKNITLVNSFNSSLFTVIGEKFSRSFTLQTGAILKEEINETLFYTVDIGVWKIYNK